MLILEEVARESRLFFFTEEARKTKKTLSLQRKNHSTQRSMKKTLTTLCLCALAATMTAQEQELWIDNGTRHIYGILNKCGKDGKRPLVIVAHGFNGTHDYSKNYFAPLAEEGYHTYAFDFPCGSIYSKSDTNTMNMSVKDQVSDLKAIVTQLAKRNDVDASQIVLVGESQGGLVAALTAAQMPHKIEKLVLVFPALCIPQNWRKAYPTLADIPDTTRLWDVKMGRRYFEEIHDMQTFDEIKHFKRPVIIIQGDKDRIVSMDDSRHALTVYKNAALKVIPGAGHGFNPTELQKAMEYIKGFLEE